MLEFGLVNELFKHLNGLTIASFDISIVTLLSKAFIISIGSVCFKNVNQTQFQLFYFRKWIYWILNICFSATAIVTVNLMNTSGATQNTYHCTGKRPHVLVLTCLKRFEAAKNVAKTGIVRVKSR